MLLTHLFETRVLNELNWRETAPIFKTLERQQGRWVHFSKVNKLGVNPRKSHKDPYGLYFYPVDWLLAGSQRIDSGLQYGLDWPYAFFADIDMSAPGLVISKVTWDDIETLAKRNGWFDLYQQRDDLDITLPHYYKPELPGSFLWHFIDRLRERGLTTWNKALSGLAYIYDDNQSVIHSNEPHQILVLDPRIIKNVNVVDNTSVPIRSQHDFATRGPAFKHIAKEIMDELAVRFHGTVIWREDKNLRPYIPGKRHRAQALPELVMKKEDREIVVTLQNTTSFFGFAISYQYGDEEGSDSLPSEAITKWSREQIIEALAHKIEIILDLKDPLRFQPYLTEKAANRLVREQMLSRGLDVTVERKIYNLVGFESVNYTATSVHTLDGIKIGLSIRLSSNAEAIRSPTIGITFNGHREFMYATAYGAHTNIATLLDELATEFAENMRNRDRLIGPEAYTRWDSAKFRNKEEFDAFLGWFAMKGGLSLGGRIQKLMAPEIGVYNAYEDKDELLYRIETVFDWFMK